MKQLIAQSFTFSGPRFDSQENLLFIVFGLLGAISVIVIIIAALRLIMFGGNNPQEVSKTKNTILYASIGLAIALSALAIVALVTEIAE
jgi:hypothetical protein